MASNEVACPSCGAHPITLSSRTLTQCPSCGYRAASLFGAWATNPLEVTRIGWLLDKYMRFAFRLPLTDWRPGRLVKRLLERPVFLAIDLWRCTRKIRGRCPTCDSHTTVVRKGHRYCLFCRGYVL